MLPPFCLTLTCETSGADRHCFDHHGYLSTEERSGDTTHGSGAANLTGRRAAFALRDIGRHELVQSSYWRSSP